MITLISKYWFLFTRLVYRDFVKKYKRAALGMAWSVLSPLATFFVMNIIFGRFFASDMPHYTIYLFCGNVLWNYFREATTGGMTALVANAEIFTKINVPKYLFVLSKNVSSLINFGLNLSVLFVFVIVNKVSFSWRFLLLIYPIICFSALCVGIGLIISALYVFYQDMLYLYEVFTMLLMYMSAIFYSIETFPSFMQMLFHLNPVFVYIKYFRTILLGDALPDWWMSVLCAGYGVLALLVGSLIYKKYNHEFMYYV